jgi:hypothetical protein
MTTKRNFIETSSVEKKDIQTTVKRGESQLQEALLRPRGSQKGAVLP